MDNKVNIERTLTVPLATLWEYWISPDLFATWFGPGDAVAKITKYNVAEGNAYEVLVVEPSGVTHTTTGVFTIVKPHELLVFTWKIHDLDMEESLVTVRFSGDETSATMHLIHEQLTPEHAQMHEFGWNAAFTKLTSILK